MNALRSVPLETSTIADVDRLEAETEDRYGHLPGPARNLFDMGRLRVRAEEVGLKSIDLAEDKLQLRFQETTNVDPARVIKSLRTEGGSLTPSGMLTLPAPERGVNRVRAARAVVEGLLSAS